MRKVRWMLLGVIAHTTVAQGVTFKVTTTDAEGPGSITAAITAANADAVVDTIAFDIVGEGPFTIQPDGLPAITQPVLIDGTTQGGWTGTPYVFFDGFASGAGESALVLSGHSGTTLRGLGFTGFSGTAAAITIQTGSNGHAIQGCYIGVEADGDTGHGNTIGIDVSGNGVLVGGDGEGEPNVIAGNGTGIRSAAGSGLMVYGNRIGLGASGGAVPNTTGILFTGMATGHDVGGPLEGQPNVISGNTVGIAITNNVGGDHLITRNLIGLDPSGSVGIAGSFGVDIQSSTAVTVGPANVIAKQTQAGVRLVGATADVFVRGNRFGTDGIGFNAVPNSFGIVVVGGTTSPSDCDIGGTTPTDPNRIVFSTNDGIALINGLTPPTGIRIRGNSIDGNGGLGIDLANDGVTSNDMDDTDDDDGPNTAINFPTLAHAYVITGTINIAGTYQGAANLPVTLDFFASVPGDASGHGEGSYYIGSLDVMTDGDGKVLFDHDFAQNIAIGAAISATATHATFGTSEFSPHVATIVSPTTTSTSTTTSSSTSTSVTSTTSSTLDVTTSTTTGSSTTTTTLAPCASQDIVGLQCLLDALPPAACNGVQLPPNITKLIGNAQARATKAAAATGKRQAKLLRKTAALLRKAAKRTMKAGEAGTLPPDCAGALAEALNDAADRAQGLALSAFKRSAAFVASAVPAWSRTRRS